MLEHILEYWLKTSTQQDCTDLNSEEASLKLEELSSYYHHLETNFYVTLEKNNLEMKKTEKCSAIEFGNHSSLFIELATDAS